MTYMTLQSVILYEASDLQWMRGNEVQNQADEQFSQVECTATCALFLFQAENLFTYLCTTQPGHKRNIHDMTCYFDWLN